MSPIELTATTRLRTYTEIKWYLQSPSDQIKERISRLLPWVQGNIDFNQRQSSVKALDVLDFLPAELGPRTDEL